MPRIQGLKADLAKYKEIADSKVYPQRLRPVAEGGSDEVRGTCVRIIVVFHHFSRVPCRVAMKQQRNDPMLLMLSHRFGVSVQTCVDLLL